MSDLRTQVESVLDRYPPETAVLVVDDDGKLLASREVPSPDHAVMVLLTDDPPPFTAWAKP